MANYIITNNGLVNADSLSHHGIKGMKWGVRRYQNKDGTLTDAGKKRAKTELTPEQKAARKKTIKKVVAVATVAAAAGLYIKNKEAVDYLVKGFISNAKSDLGDKKSVMRMKDLSSKAVSKGKAYVKTTIKAAKEGAKEAAKEAPKKAAKAVVTGITLNTVKRALDAAVGKEESARIFQANDNKKIGKFWKVQDDDRDD